MKTRSLRRFAHYWLVVLAIFVAAPMATNASANTSAAAELQQKSWWDDTPWKDPERGFSWYPDPKQAKAPAEEAKPKEVKPKTLYEMTNIEDLEKELKRLKGAAVMNPTEKNVHEFLQAQNYVMNKSSVFADTARRVVWSNPDVNYSARSPVVSSARTAEGKRRKEDIRETVQELSRDDGILFFAKSDCPYCHDQAPILKLFERDMGMSVMAISIDGGAIPNFPNAKRDNGISMKVSGGEGVTTVPALYLVNRKTFEALPLGTGVMAVTDITERIRVLTKTKPGDDF